LLKKTLDGKEISVMRITRTRYESAKKRLAKMEALLNVTRRWEQTMREMGDTAAANVVAIETTKDNTVKVEFGITQDKTHSTSNQTDLKN
jgi:hypothetical protein